MHRHPEKPRPSWPYVAAVAVLNSLLWIGIGWLVTFFFPSVSFRIFLIVGLVAGLIIAFALYLLTNAR